MGYTTDFEGSISVTPPMKPELITFLNKFANTRRMNRTKGPDYVDGPDFGEDIINHNTPPEGQPGLWCQWIPSEDGTEISWDGEEKFYLSPQWMKYIIDRYLVPAGHTCNGEIEAFGEDPEDRWKIIVRNNHVTTAEATVYTSYRPEEEVA